MFSTMGVTSVGANSVLPAVGNSTSNGVAVSIASAATLACPNTMGATAVVIVPSTDATLVKINFGLNNIAYTTPTAITTSTTNDGFNFPIISSSDRFIFNADNGNRITSIGFYNGGGGAITFYVNWIT